MSAYNTFDLNIQCDEMTEEVSEAEQAEVMAMMAEEAEGFTAYGEWSAEVEDGKDWLGGYTNRRSGPSLDGIDI